VRSQAPNKEKGGGLGTCNPGSFTHGCTARVCADTSFPTFETKT